MHFLEGDKVQSLRQGSPTLLLGCYYPADFSSNLASIIKGALSKFCQTMLIFEGTKTNTPVNQHDLAPILKSLPHTYVHNHGNDDCGNKWRWHTSIFKQKPTQISCVKQCKINVNHLSRRSNTTSASDSRPSRSLCFSPPLESSSDIYAGPTSCLIVTLLFNVLFLWYFPLFYLPSLFIYSRSANIRPVHSNWVLSSLYHY